MTEPRAKILLVDDEPQIARALRRSLETHGYEVRVASDGEAALDLFSAWTPDLLITDLAMPFVNGIELCSRIRGISDLPIIVLSVKGEEETKVEALDAGADDYVTKPFGIPELLARIRALLRRKSSTADRPEEEMEIGDFHILPQLRRVIVRGREVHLTPKEYELLIFLVANRGRVLTHKAILTAIWGTQNTDQGEYLRVFIGQLRKKLERNPATPKYIQTEPWIGYRFDPGA